jgi:kynurenine formamidase
VLRIGADDRFCSACGRPAAPVAQVSGSSKLLGCAVIGSLAIVVVVLVLEFSLKATRDESTIIYGEGTTAAADAIALGTHVGTHIDALSHFSCNGTFFGNRRVEHSYERGMADLGVDTIAPIVRRGVVLDIAGLECKDALPEDFEVTPTHLSRASQVEIRAGDVVMIRTGWAQFFSDSKRYINNTAAPGPGIEGARWLSSRHVFAVGSDTVVFEKTPNSAMPVHVHLLVESGIHIIEVLNLEEVARDGIHEFLFVAAPMNIRGATGAPLRPLAFPLPLKKLAEY